MNKNIIALFLLFVSAKQVFAGAYQGLVINTTVGRATQTLSGQFSIAASSQTASTFTIRLDGVSGGVNASSFTAVYGVIAATANISGLGRFGQVGINETGPGTPLSVNGGTAISASSLSGFAVFGSTSGNHIAVSNTGIQGKTNAALAGPINLQPAGSNVGIQESAPATPLSVNGGTAISLSGMSGFEVVGSTFGNHLAISNTDIQAKSNPTTATSLFLQPLGGNIAIGTTTATEELFVYKDQNGPTDIQVENRSAGASAITEFRVTNGTGAGDFFIAGTGFTDGSNFLPNEVGVVAETSAAGLHLRSNGPDDPIRMSVNNGSVLAERFRLKSNGMVGISTGNPVAMVDISTGPAVDFLKVNDGTRSCVIQLGATGACPSGYSAIGTDDSIDMCMECN